MRRSKWLVDVIDFALDHGYVRDGKYICINDHPTYVYLSDMARSYIDNSDDYDGAIFGDVVDTIYNIIKQDIGFYLDDIEEEQNYRNSDVLDDNLYEMSLLDKI